MSQMSEELKRFEEDLKKSAEAREKLEVLFGRIVKEGKAQSDGEAMVLAAKEMGYQITLADLDKKAADAEALDTEEMERVTGGATDLNVYYESKNGEEIAKRNDCTVNYACDYIWNQQLVDENGHNTWCLAYYNCHTVLSHGSDDQNTSCWSNYKCMMNSH